MRSCLLSLGHTPDLYQFVQQASRMVTPHSQDGVNAPAVLYARVHRAMFAPPGCAYDKNSAVCG